MHSDYLAMQQAVVDGDVETARRLARSLIESTSDLLPAIEQGFAAGIRRVGELWEEGEYFLPELVQGAEAMKAAMEVIQPALRSADRDRQSKGRIVIGTVEGDLHDIGKSLVAVLLAANGFHESRGIDRGLLIGAIIIQFGAIAWQGGSIYAKQVLKNVSPLMSAAVQAVIGGVFLDIVGLVAGEASRLHPTPRSLAAWAYLTIAGSIIGYTAYTCAVSKIPITTMSLYTYVNPVVAVILGALILKERLTPLSVLGMAVILIGMTIVQSTRQRAVKPVIVMAEERERENAA